MRRLVFVLLAVALLAGCGTSDDQTQARATTERFYAAMRAHDGTRACAQLSQEAIKSLEQQESKPCRAAVRSLQLQGGRVLRTRVYITNAIVDLSGGEYAFLGREPTGWKLDAVGCRFDQGKPRDRPADCEAEA
jgi:ABC-type glycerol-3-phosphate transport system substrate-binding protein